MSAEDDFGGNDAEFWHIIAHVHGKEVVISVGDASQRIKWVAQVAIARWDDDNCQGWKRLGIPTTVRVGTAIGEEVEMGRVIRDALRNGEHIYISTSLNPIETR